MRYVPSGQAVTSFSVATNRRYTTADGERHDETEWFRISAWGRLAETCNQFLTKGRQVYVEGRLSSRTYETRDGQTRFVNEITANDVRFLGQGSGGESQGQPSGGESQGQPSGGEFQSQEGEETGTGGTEPDDLPF